MMKTVSCMFQTAVLLVTLAVSPAMAAPPNRAAAPSPARCPATPPIEAESNDRKGPLKIPARYAAVARSDLTRLAVAALSGANFCQNISAINKAENFALSSDGRFFSFDWYGYEEGGHVIIDRTGSGQSIDSGAEVTLSPSGQRFAAVQFSEAGFGALEGFAVWQINSVGLRQLVKLDEIPSLVDWRIDSWSGENCINLSGIPNDRIPENTQNYSRVKRDRYIARPSGASWRLTRARSCPAG